MKDLKILPILCWLLLGALLLVSCGPSSQELILLEHETIMHPHATLLYEKSYTASGATGDCASSSVHRWYGMNIEINDDVLKTQLEGQLFENGWSDEGIFWRKVDDEGRFTARIETFTGNIEINPARAYYRLPDIIMNKFSGFSFNYLFSIDLMTPSAFERCFGD